MESVSHEFCFFCLTQRLNRGHCCHHLEDRSLLLVSGRTSPNPDKVQFPGMVGDLVNRLFLTHHSLSPKEWEVCIILHGSRHVLTLVGTEPAWTRVDPEKVKRCCWCPTGGGQWVEKQRKTCSLFYFTLLYCPAVEPTETDI